MIKNLIFGELQNGSWRVFIVLSCRYTTNINKINCGKKHFLLFLKFIIKKSNGFAANASQKIY